jgi:hypothetical protein
MNKPTPSEAGRALSELGASKGGKASAAKLTLDQRRERGATGGRASAASLSPEERSTRASRAARARWARVLEVVESRALAILRDLRRRLDFDGNAVLDIMLTEESTELAERFLRTARHAMPEFAGDRREFDQFTADERQRVCDRAIRYAISAECDAAIHRGRVYY